MDTIFFAFLIDVLVTNAKVKENVKNVCVATNAVFAANAQNKIAINQ